MCNIGNETSSPSSSECFHSGEQTDLASRLAGEGTIRIPLLRRGSTSHPPPTRTADPLSLPSRGRVSLLFPLRVGGGEGSGVLRSVRADCSEGGGEAVPSWKWPPPIRAPSRKSSKTTAEEGTASSARSPMVAPVLLPSP